MKTPLLVLVAALVVPLLNAQVPAPPPGAPAAPAVPEPLSDEQMARILEEITKVQKEFASTKKQVVENALSKFQSALADDTAATDLYLASYRVVHLERKPATTKEEMKERESGEWKQRALAALGTGASATTLRLPLQLLVLHLQAATGREEAKTVAALREIMQGVAAYLQALASAPPPEPDKRAAANGPRGGARRPADDQGRGRAASVGGRALQQNVMSSLFAEAYNLDTYLDDVKGLPQSPLDFNAAYTGLLLPWYRANRLADLSGVWDEYLRLETLKVQAAHDPAGAAAWAADEYKQLYWSKWLDLLTHGVSAPMATTELITLIRENPLHPRLKTWVADLAKVGEKMGGLKFGEAELSAGTPPSPPPPPGGTVSQ